jgi:tetratricopeptide (TPR) repeat protein
MKRPITDKKKVAGGNGGNNTLFISHNATDRPYAVALQEAIHGLLDRDKTLIDVRYSTSSEDGPQGGEKWREWIYRQVVEARTALIVVTPQALGKPWLLWEAGACWGAALAQKANGGVVSDDTDSRGLSALGKRLNVSIAYGLSENECPDPLRGDQIVLGNNRERMDYLLRRILQVHDVPGNVLLNAGAHMEEVLNRYLAAVRTALLQAPSQVNEANVQDWLSRLEKLVQSNRLSELPGFQRWMTLAFGRDGEASGIPIDVRLHRRLGELYLAQKDYAPAVEQLNLARRAAPRDVYVLRPLAEVSMKRLLADSAAAQATAAREEIQSLLDAIQDLDKQAFVAMPDAAALYGKYLRRVIGDPERAVEVYAEALNANGDSYYLADLLGQTQLELDRKDDARKTYARALDIIGRLGESNVWTLATAASACLVLGDADATRRHLMAIAALGHRQSEIDAIQGGLREIAQRLGLAQSSLDALLLATTSRSDNDAAP